MARVGGALTIGRDVELAARVGAAGVQLGAAADVAPARVRLGRGVLLGVSAHSLDDVRAAREAGADYATLSPIFLTASKPGYGPALGLDSVRAAAAILPTVALGGIDPTTAPSMPRGRRRRRGGDGGGDAGAGGRGADSGARLTLSRLRPLSPWIDRERSGAGLLLSPPGGERAVSPCRGRSEAQPRVRGSLRMRLLRHHPLTLAANLRFAAP